MVWCCVRWELMKQTEVYLPSYQKKARRGLMRAFAQQQGRENTHTLHAFHRAKRLPMRSTGIPGLESQRQRLHLKHPFQHWQSQHRLPPSLTGSLRSWWVPIPGNVSLSLATRGCSPSQRRNQCHRCTQTGRGAFISCNRRIWARGKLEN